MASKSPAEKSTDKKPVEKKQFTREEKREFAQKKSAARLEKNGGADAIRIFYDRSTRDFIMNIGTDYEILPEAKIKLHLQAHGFDARATHESGMPMLDWPFCEATKNGSPNKVDFAGSIPGWRKGLHTLPDGRKFLITSEALGVYDDVEPLKPGAENMFIVNFLFELLGREQAEHLCYSLNAGLKSLRRGDFRMAPFTWFVGPPECGKSLGLFILRYFYGGRVANPASVLFKDESKTGHLLKGEVWMFSDPNTGKDKRTRESLGDTLKAMFHEEEFSFRGLYREEFLSSCWRRGFGAINRQPEQVKLIPPMVEGVGDKNTLYLCNMATETLAKFCFENQKNLKGFDPSSNGVDKLAVQQRIFAEMPQFRSWILNMFNDVPEKWLNKRYGVSRFHSKELLSMLSNLSPEARFLEILDELMFLDATEEDQSVFQRRTAKGYKTMLCESKYYGQVKDVVHKTATYLGQLAEAMPDRVSKDGYDTNGIQIWKITNPFIKKKV